MSKLSELTPKQEFQIAQSPLTYDQICETFHVDRKTVSFLKQKYGTNKGRQGNGGAINCKITPAQRLEIINSPLSPKELSEIYPLHKAYISRIRTSAGVKTGAGNYPRNSSNSNKIDFTAEQMELVKDLNISAMQLSKQIGIANEVISRERIKLGLSYREFQKAKKKARPPKPRPMVKKSDPKPKKEKAVKVVKVKELPVKIIKPKKEVSPIKESSYTYEMKQLARAKRNADDYKQTEADKLKNGWRYITIPGRFNIKETKLVSPEDYIRLKKELQ